MECYVPEGIRRCTRKGGEMSNSTDISVWRKLDESHRRKLERKRQKRAMLISLIEVWEAKEDYEYARALRVKLNSVENQLKAMGV